MTTHEGTTTHEDSGHPDRGGAMGATAFPLRQVHLDFHNAPAIPDIGADWDPEHFAHTLRAAHVASVTVFAKCHHGMNYYPTRIGPVHPALGFDLLGEQIRACHGAGIRCPIYLSVGFDVDAAARHPEWRQVRTDGRLAGPGPLEPGFPLLCVNTAYADELAAQTEELMDRYACDGFFYDIVMYDPEGCVCAACLADLRRAGDDPADPARRDAHNNLVARRFMRRMSAAVRARLSRAGLFYNSRWGLRFVDEADAYAQIELEALATGGWGYGFYPLWSRYARTFGLPLLGMTGRFQGHWADWGGLKHPDALRFESATILAAGGAVSIGDQMHPRGRLNPAVYEAIGAALGDVETVESCCMGAEAAAQIGLLALEGDGTHAEARGASGALEGAAKLLLELHHQFDVITARCPDFGAYEALVVPDQGTPSPAVVARLRAYVAGGGRLLLSHEALLDRDAGDFALADLMGVRYDGPAASMPDYFTLADAALHTAVTRPDFAYTLYEGPSVRVVPEPGTGVLAQAHESYFNRTAEHFSSHLYSPPLPQAAGYPAVTRRDDVVYIYGPIFAAYQRHGNLTFRALVGRLLDLLLPRPMVTTDAPATAEVSLLRRGADHVVHVVNYHAARRAPAHAEALETPPPLRDVAIRLRLSNDEDIDRVYLARDGTTLPHTREDGYVAVVVPRVGIHEAIVFAHDAHAATGAG